MNINGNPYGGYYVTQGGDRFWVPFLLGGLGGAAVVGLSRPRPVYVNQPAPAPYPYPPRPPYAPYGGGSYGYSGYNYYY